MSDLQKQDAPTNAELRSVEKEKKGTPEGHLAPVAAFPARRGVAPLAVRAAKSSVDYWKERVRPRTLKDGRQTAELYVRMKESGRDAWVCLDSANRAEAARKARDLWQLVQVKGMVAALAEFHPKAAPRPDRSATVGEFIKAAKTLTTVRASSLHEYEKSLRRLVAGVLGMKPTPAIYVAGSEASVAWRSRIEGASLDVLAGPRVEAWRKQYIDAAPDERARISRRNTASAVIRNARALFTPSVVAGVSGRLRLPDPLPMSGLKAGTSTRRFKTSVDARRLYAEANRELAGDTLTAFLLCITAGLRRIEADLLPWENVDLTARTVEIRPTRFFVPKTEESRRTIPLPADVVSHLEARRLANDSAEFVLFGLDPSKPRALKTYRAQCWESLATWLRSKGFASQNPIHELRKLSGSLVNAKAGLEAARKHLGHRSIATTSASYVAGSAALVDLSGSN